MGETVVYVVWSWRHEVPVAAFSTEEGATEAIAADHDLHVTRFILDAPVPRPDTEGEQDG